MLREAFEIGACINDAGREHHAQGRQLRTVGEMKHECSVRLAFGCVDGAGDIADGAIGQQLLTRRLQELHRALGVAG